MNRWELEKKIAMHALKDPAFKKMLLSNPKAALKDFLKREKGFNIATLDRLNFKVIEEKKNEWTLCLPYFAAEGQKLSDADLEKLFAAGGCESPGQFPFSGA